MGQFEGASPLQQSSSPSPWKERGIQVEDSSRGEVRSKMQTELSERRNLCELLSVFLTRLA